jgi:hypothetical protein
MKAAIKAAAAPKASVAAAAPKPAAPKPAAPKPVLKKAAVSAALEKHCRRHSYEVAQLAAFSLYLPVSPCTSLYLPVSPCISQVAQLAALQPVAPPSLSGPSGGSCPREALASFCKEADARAIVRAHEALLLA